MRELPLSTLLDSELRPQRVEHQASAPAWDADFDMADLPMMMRLNELPARYRRHFIE